MDGCMDGRAKKGKQLGKRENGKTENEKQKNEQTE
jgi:hypothetical protein